MVDMRKNQFVSKLTNLFSYLCFNLITIKIKKLSLPDMTLISQITTKPRNCKKCFTMYLEQRTPQNPERYSILQKYTK
jgi:hypothetical protein